MRVLNRLLLAALVATPVVALAAVGATANRLEISNFERGFNIKSGSIKFMVGEKTVDCEERLIGTFHSRTMPKTEGLLIGYINMPSIINLCTGGTAVFLTETLPWHVRYASFSGTLPKITQLTLQIVGLRVLIRPTLGVSCLATTTTTNPLTVFAIMSATEAIIESIRFNEAVGIPLTGMGCPGEGRIGGEGVITVPAELASIQVRLI
jgi:hypothetical protein